MEEIIVSTLMTAEKLPMPSERKQLAHRPRFSESQVGLLVSLGMRPLNTSLRYSKKFLTPGTIYDLGSKSTANDYPFSSPIGLRLLSPHPRANATIPENEQQYPLAPLTTSQSGLDATIRLRQVRREVAQDRNRRSHDLEHPALPNPSGT